MSAKRLLFRAAGASGALAAVRASRWRAERLMVLCYHGISLRDEHECDPGLFMSPETFRGRLRALRDGGYRVLALDEAVARLYEGTLPPLSVALTFDDGFVDFAERAAPMLDEFGFPGTVYLTTYYCEHRMPVFNTALRYVLWAGRASGADLAPLVGAPVPLGVGDAARAATAEAFYAFVDARGLSAGEKDALLGRVAARVGVDYAAFRRTGMHQIMAPEQVRALPAAADVELHTHRHRTPRDEALFRREIADNRRAIEGLTGRTPGHFCYPSGDYDGAFLPWLRAEGVRSATTCVPGLASAADDPLLIPRFVDTEQQPLAAFEAWTSGFAAALPQGRAYRLDPARLRGAAPVAGPVTGPSSSSGAGSP